MAIVSAGCVRAVGNSPAPIPGPRPALAPSGASRPDAAQNQFTKGVHLLEKGQTEEARFVFEKLRDDYPKISVFYVNLGVTYKRLGLLPEAITSYQRALEIDRGDAAIYYNMGIALREAGEFRKAEQSYKTALVIFPDFMDAHYNLAVLYDLYLNQPNEAIEHYRRYLELGGGSLDEVQIWIAALQKRMNESGKAP
jgi:tetratricopeptide (TPR) repeat protein